VAKVPPASDDSAQEGEGLAAWGGTGAVRLLDRSPEGVLLMERAAPGTPTEHDAVVGATLARLWIEPPPGVAWRTADALAEGWAATVEHWRDRLGRRVADAAAAAFRAGFGPGPRRLLHGDGHHGNVLDGGARGWLAIDPQPLVGPPALDLAPSLYNGPDGSVDERIAVLAAAAGVDAEAVARFAGPRCLLSAAWALDDDTPVGVLDRSLTAARALL
jgi:streptomycin 6-kinase